MNKVISMIAVVAFMFSMNVNGQEKKPVKAKTEKMCSASEKKSCSAGKKGSCCAAKKMEEKK